MKRILLSLSLILALALANLSLKAQALSIDDIVLTESTCESNGSAQVVASGGDTSQPYQYAIVAGPVTFPFQSSDIFTTLSPGVYSFEVRDNSGTVAPGTAQVLGNYAAMNPTFTLTPYTCETSMDAEIQVDLTGGLAPYEYALIAPSVELRPFQPSNIFDNLTEGDYTVQVRDDCGNIQTRSVTVAGWTDPIDRYATNLGVTKVCGATPTYDMTLYWGKDPIDEDSPLEFRIYDAATNTLLATVPLVQNTVPSVNVPAPTDPLQGYYVESFDTVCNRVKHSFTRVFRDPVLTSSIDPVANACGQYDVEISTNGFDNLFHCDQTTWTLRNTVSGAVISTVTTNFDPSSTTYRGVLPNVPVGTYEGCYENCCGDTFCLPVTVAEPARSLTSVTRPFWTCMNETTTVTVNALNYNLPYDLYLEAAPASITTSAGNFPANYNVGDLLTTQNSGTNNFYSYSNLGVGTYIFRVEDNCGNIDKITVDVTPADLRMYEFSYVIEEGCANAHKVSVTGTDNTTALWIPNIYVDNVKQNTTQFYQGTQTVEFPNLPAGALRVEISTNDVGNPFFGTCPNITVFNDVIQPYVQPEIPVLDAYDCTGGNTIIAAEAGKGVGPYTYELYQGGALLASQAGDGMFSVNAVGTFDVRVVDACMNSVNRSVTAGALVPPSITPTPTCINGGIEIESVMFEASVVFGATYEWRDPNGVVIGTDRILDVNPFAPGDAGEYTVSISLPGGNSGCTNVSNAITINTGYCRTLPVELTYFNTKLTDQNTVDLSWQTATEQNNERFEIERSTNGQDWTVIETQDGAGNSSAPINYSAMDLYPVAGKNYYRLKQVDFDGQFSYSDISVEEVENTNAIEILPNVLESNGILTVLNRKGQINTVVIYDISGRTVAHFDGLDANSSKSFQLPSLERGIYLVHFSGKAISESQKIMIK